MFWADRVAQELKDNNQHIDDMFTPSGFGHIGSLRGPVLHDVMYRALHAHNKNTVFTYIFNDFDPIDGLPPDLQTTFNQYLGYPLRSAPSPDGKQESFAHYFTHNFKTVLESLGVHATYVSSWDMYHEGKFNEVIRIALDNKEKILAIYRDIAGYQSKDENWFPLQVICPRCKKLGTTKVISWDGAEVKFHCEPKLVKWAQGCGLEDTISPFDGNGKLPWKVDWPAHWKVLGVTFEGAGKDHASKGGSYDIAFQLCKDVLNIPTPYYFPYEFFLFGGKKMSSSKGIGLKASDLTKILPPAVARFLIVRTQPRSALEFDPNGWAIPDLFDEYDKCWQAYVAGSDSDLARIFELSQIDPNNLPEKKGIFIPRFRAVAQMVQNLTSDPHEFFEKEKGNKLTEVEKNLLEERVKYAKLWHANYAPEEVRFTPVDQLPQQAKSLSVAQKHFLAAIAEMIPQFTNEAEFGKALYGKIKEIGIAPKDAFAAIYLSFLGKPHGPKAAMLLLSFPRDFVIKRLQEAVTAS